MKSNLLFSSLSKLRQLSAANIPFSISYVSYSSTNNSSEGVKTVHNITLRTGLSSAHSDKAKSLIGYTELDTGKHRWFYLPLLLRINNQPL